MDLKDIQSWEWERIYEKRPDLRKVPEPSLDSVIMEFLKQYEVYVKPASTGEHNRAADAVMGGLMGGLGGPAAVGLDSGLRNQEKKAAVQEWTQWKQWALGHEDFPAFREAFKGKTQKHNANVDELLASDLVREEIKHILEEQERLEKSDLVVIKWMIFILLPIALITTIFIGLTTTIRETEQERIEREMWFKPSE